MYCVHQGNFTVTILVQAYFWTEGFLPSKNHTTQVWQFTAYTLHRVVHFSVSAVSIFTHSKVVFSQWSIQSGVNALPCAIMRVLSCPPLYGCVLFISAWLCMYTVQSYVALCNVYTIELYPAHLVAGSADRYILHRFTRSKFCNTILRLAW